MQITSSGRGALHDAERAQVAIEDEVLAALDADERRTLRELLNRALRSVEPADGDAHGATVASISA